MTQNKIDRGQILTSKALIRLTHLCRSNLGVTLEIVDPPKLPNSLRCAQEIPRNSQKWLRPKQEERNFKIIFGRPGRAMNHL